MRKQSDTESVDAYIAVLRTLVKSCNYWQTCVTSILRDQIVLGVKNKELSVSAFERKESYPGDVYRYVSSSREC